MRKNPGVERRHAQERSAAAWQLHRVTELYRLLVQSVIDYAIFVLDVDGTVLTWNPGAEHLNGYTEREILGRNFSVLYPEEDRRSLVPETLLDKTARDGHVERDGWNVRKDGTRFYCSVSMTALRDEKGSLIGFAKITRDLTRPREHADLLESSKQLARATRVAKKETATAWEAEGQARFLVKASDILASSLEYETTLQQLAEVAVPDLADWCAVSLLDDGSHRQVAVAHVDRDKAQWARELNRKYPPNPDAKVGVPNVIRTGKPELYEDIPDELLAASASDPEHLRILREVGMKSAMIVPLIAHGRTLGALSLVSDTSGRRYTNDDMSLAMKLAQIAALAVDNVQTHLAEQEARRAAEAANLAKMQFLSVMSHELRTPLNAISGYAELLKIGVHGPVTPQQEQDLDRIIRNQRGLVTLIDEVLNYAKLEAGRVELEPESVPVRRMLLDVEEPVQPQLNANELSYRSDVCDPAVRRARRSGQDAAGASQPAVERHQVHACRR